MTFGGGGAAEASLGGGCGAARGESFGGNDRSYGGGAQCVLRRRRVERSSATVAAVGAAEVAHGEGIGGDGTRRLRRLHAEYFNEFLGDEQEVEQRGSHQIWTAAVAWQWRMSSEMLRARSGRVAAAGRSRTTSGRAAPDQRGSEEVGMGGGQCRGGWRSELLPPAVKAAASDETTPGRTT
uniref:Uncharacterized protein n=1 Tax=Oryza barthii TaxID=65489 RepID=A0A0D3FLF2_9ORYZ